MKDMKTRNFLVALLALLWSVDFTEFHHAQARGAEDRVTLQLKWHTQSQFAGYYVALEKGFYAEENLDVLIKSGGPGIATPEVLAKGSADVIVDWMPSALAAREAGVPLVHIAQPFDASALMLVCRKDRGISSPVHFGGKRFGVWLAGNEYPFLSWINRLGLSIDGGEDGVEILEQGADVSLLSSGRADCISMLTYGFWQLDEAGFGEEELVVFRYENQGLSVLEDGLYVLEESLTDPTFTDKMARFVRASMRGWQYAEERPDEAVKIVLAYDIDGNLDKETQTYMMREVLKLTRGSDGRLDVSDYWRTVNILLSGGTVPVITEWPVGAWTRKISDAAVY